MRRPRRAVSAKRRSVDWGGASWWGSQQVLTFTNVNDFNTYDVAAFWVVWPRGAPDPNNNGLVPEQDDTLVRVINAFVVATDNGDVQANNVGATALGLIKWTEIDPDPDPTLTNGRFPCPFDHSEDWLWRNIIPRSVDNTFNSIPVDFDAVQSRAMRKMRAGEGILAVISQWNFGATGLFVDWWWDVRAAVKKAV